MRNASDGLELLQSEWPLVKLLGYGVTRSFAILLLMGRWSTKRTRIECVEHTAGVNN